MSRLKREGNPPSGQWASPVPQAWDPNLNDFREITGQNLGGGRFGADGVQWGKTASGLFVPIKVTNDGTQEVQLSGNMLVETISNAVTVPSGTPQLLKANIPGKGAREIWLAVNSSVPSWTLSTSITPWASLQYANERGNFPIVKDVPHVVSETRNPYLFLKIHGGFSGFSPIVPAPSTFKEAKELAWKGDFNAYFSHNSEGYATVTLRVMYLY